MLHKDLSNGRWNQLSLIQQLANVGAEFERFCSWRNKNLEYETKAQVRLLELLDLTLSDPRFQGRLRELARLRELVCDETCAGQLKDYFLHFALAARK